MSARATLSEYAKAVILVLDGDGNPDYPIPVMFNPTEYRLEKSVRYGEQSLPGLEAPITQFVGGQAETLSMQLFVDTYEEGIDVRTYTDRIDHLLEVDGEIHAPPVCRFVWGSLVFTSVLESVSKRFTMFLPGGFPVRAELDVTFRRYDPPSDQRARTSRQSADRTTVRVVTAGDSLPLIAAKEYGDPGRWRSIARANDIDDPRSLEPGTELVVPPLERER